MLLGVHVRNVKVRPGPLATVVLTGHLAHDARKILLCFIPNSSCTNVFCMHTLFFVYA